MVLYLERPERQMIDKGQNNKKLYKETNLKIIFAVTLMAVLGVSSITPAFPKIIKAFKISSHSIGLLITAFTLPGVILTPLMGVLSDRFGRKPILIPSLFLFGIAGFLCSLAPNYHVLVLLRVLQGIGAAAIGSLNVTILGDIYSGKDRPAAMGYNASVLSIGTAAYPALGGALAMLSWRYPFIMPLAAIPIGIITMLYLKNPEPKKNESFRDYFQGVLKSIDRRVIGLYSSSIITFIILYGAYLTYYPILIDDKFTGTPVMIGVIMSIMSITTALSASQLGKLAQRFRGRNLIVISFMIYALSLAITPFIGNLWGMILPAVIYGIAHGINIPTIQTILSELAPIEHRGAFMSFNGMVLRIGQSLGPVLTGFFYALWSLNGAFLAAACFAVLAAIAAMFAIHDN